MTPPRKDPNIDILKDIPFTARLMAYYRAQESIKDDALLVDPFAALLAGNLSEYFGKYSRHSQKSDYPIIRSYYIDEHLLKPWCTRNSTSQIVLLGAGLDSRAYWFEPLRMNKHILFEVDFPSVISYKQRILKDSQPLCELNRVSADLSSSDWAEGLMSAGFDSKVHTFWILEGIAYYIEQELVTQLLNQMREMSSTQSMIFADICVPALAEADFGAFMAHFKWGLDIKEVSGFFGASGWDVTASFADDHDEGRDVGQRGQIFVEGTVGEIKADIQSPSKDTIGLAQLGLMNILSDVENIVATYANDHERALQMYIDFIRRMHEPMSVTIKEKYDPVSIGRISPRLLRDPLQSGIDQGLLSYEEEEAHVLGYLKAILSLIYCIGSGIDIYQLSDTQFIKEDQKVKNIQDLRKLTELVKHEINI